MKHRPKHVKPETARDRVGNLVKRPYVAIPLAVSAVAMMGVGYNDVRDRLDPTRVERQVIDDLVGEVFGRRHIEIQCGASLGPKDKEVRVSADLEPGGYIYAVKQDDETNITIRLSEQVCATVVSYNKDPGDPSKISAAIGPLLQILDGVDRVAGVNPDPKTNWYWTPDDLPYPVTDTRMLVCHAPQALTEYLVVAGTPADTAVSIGSEQAKALGTSAIPGCAPGGTGDMRLSAVAASAIASR